jgi:far upstream element-binding protein
MTFNFLYSFNVGLLIGPRGATQKQMQEMSGAKIIIRGRGSQKEGAPPSGHPDDEDELHVSIEGSDEAIEKALKEVQQILFNPEQAMRLKHEQLKNLAELNGTPGMGGGGGADSIYGPGFTTKSDNPEDSYQVELRVPNGMVGLIIGKGGENIQKMQSQTGVHVQIAKESDMKPGETLRSIVLKGKPDSVAECKRRVDEIINSRSQQGQQQFMGGGGGGGGGGFRGPNPASIRELDHSFVLKVPVPNDKVGVIIGKGGMTIKGIQERCRAMVQIPPAADDDNQQVRTLSIGGDTQEAVEAAQAEIAAVLQQQVMQAQQQAQQTQAGPSSALYITVPDDKVGVVIGKGGITIKDIQNR